MIKCTKYSYPEMSLTRRAHKSEEMGAPRKMHLRIRRRAHVSAYQRKQGRRDADKSGSSPNSFLTHSLG